MLPDSYNEEIAKKFEKDCSSELLSEREFDLAWHFLIFLEDQWLNNNGSRLLMFFEALYAKGPTGYQK